MRPILKHLIPRLRNVGHRQGWPVTYIYHEWCIYTTSSREHRIGQYHTYTRNGVHTLLLAGNIGLASTIHIPGMVYTYTLLLAGNSQSVQIWPTLVTDYSDPDNFSGINYGQCGGVSRYKGGDGPDVEDTWLV